MGSTNRDRETTTTTSARWRWLADRLARYAWLILIVAVALALAGGATPPVGELGEGRGYWISLGSSRRSVTVS